ncbi:hypothetical protein E8E12_000310, partial [Didymella heteroderae]
MQLQESVSEIGEVLKSLAREFTLWRHSIESRLPPAQALWQMSQIAPPEAKFAALGGGLDIPSVPSPSQETNQMRCISNMETKPPDTSHSQMFTVVAQGLTLAKRGSMLTGLQQPKQQAQGIGSEHSVVRRAPRLVTEKSGLQSDHTTPAHKLLEEWHSMAHFCRNIDYIEKLIEGGHELSEYPMLLEQGRGLLRVWGVGEGQDPHDGAQGPRNPDGGGGADAVCSALGNEGVWGYSSADTSNSETVPGKGSSSHPRQNNNSGLGPDSGPDCRSHILWELYASYVGSIHKLHPFMDTSRLRRMIEDFSEQYSPDVNNRYAGSPTANALTKDRLNQGLKRKRSGNGYGEPWSTEGVIERSLRNALVLLVLALDGSWGVYADYGFKGEMPSYNRLRNVDVLPGMRYFAHATDILGYQQGGNTVAHAQAMILAALYL